VERDWSWRDAARARNAMSLGLCRVDKRNSGLLSLVKPIALETSRD
jgi:hypothetical protein